MRKIEYYSKANGSKPVKEFIDSLEDKYALKIFWVLKLIKETQNFAVISTEYFKKLTPDIWEIRAKVGRNTFRLLCFCENSNLIILTNGFRKKTQKIPRREIELAKKRKNKHLQRRNKNG